MSVYVDNANLPFGTMIMCHMLADTPAELKEMALKIGVQLKWFQNKASTPHFDIAKSKKQLALKAGAIELTNKADVVKKCFEIKRTWPRDSDFWLLE